MVLRPCCNPLWSGILWHLFLLWNDHVQVAHPLCHRRCAMLWAISSNAESHCGDCLCTCSSISGSLGNPSPIYSRLMELLQLVEDHCHWWTSQHSAIWKFFIFRLLCSFFRFGRSHPSSGVITAEKKPCQMRSQLTWRPLETFSLLTRVNPL